MSDTSFFRIPGNVKQSVLPFVLKREAKLNKVVRESKDLISVKTPQIFTFRTIDSSFLDTFDSGIGEINFIPSSIKNMLKDDLSFNVLYDNNKSDITFEKYLEQIPKVQIREFIPDTQLDQCINIFNDIMEALGINISNAFSGAAGAIKDFFSSSPNDDDAKMGLIEKVKLGFKALAEYFTGEEIPNISNDLKDLSTGMSFLNSDEYQRLNTFLLKLPYLLYYKLQSTTSTNIYEIPAINTNKEISRSDGNPGWGAENTGFGIDKIPILKHLPGAKTIFSNISISYMPWWDPLKGRSVPFPDVEINFDLINDTKDAAMINFIFINTIVPNNKFIQYSIFTHSPNLYDVKIDGVTRLFSCSGQHTVTYDGILRNPTYEWIDELCKKYASKGYAGTPSELLEFENYLINNNIIKIPDVYHVKMIFKSLLTDNFNQFLFQYNNNNDILYGKNISLNSNSNTIYQSSIFSDLIGVISKSMNKKYNDLLTKTPENEIKGSNNESTEKPEEKKIETKQSMLNIDFNQVDIY